MDHPGPWRASRLAKRRSRPPSGSTWARSGRPRIGVKLDIWLQAGAVPILKVNSWEYGRAEGDHFAKVASGLRLIDAGSGDAVRNARHERLKTSMLFRPALHDIAGDLVEATRGWQPMSFLYRMRRMAAVRLSRNKSQGRSRCNSSTRGSPGGRGRRWRSWRWRASC